MKGLRPVVIDTSNVPSTLSVSLPVTCRELADLLCVHPAIVLAKSFRALGRIVKLRSVLDAETVKKLGHVFGCEIDVTDDPET